MRWIIPAAVAAMGIGIVLLVQPFGKGVALILPPQVTLVLVLIGTVGIVVGVTGSAWSRSKDVGAVTAIGSTPVGNVRIGAGDRIANGAALVGLILAIASVLALSLVWIGEPILASLQGPDPCGPSTFLSNRQPDMSCFSAHPDYYHCDPVAGSCSTPVSRLSQSLAPVGLAIVPLALGGVLIGWLALSRGTRRIRITLSAMVLGAVVVLGTVVTYVVFLFGGGD